jgi:hypothetical protein
MITEEKQIKCYNDCIWHCYVCNKNITNKIVIQLSERIMKDYTCVTSYHPSGRMKDIFICLNCWKNNAGKDWMFE